MSAKSPSLLYNNDDSLRATAVTVTSTFGNNLKATNYGSNVATIDASSRTKSINITGNAKNNYITATKANDTLTGGAGNDTLTSGDGKDVFIYSAGNDVITDYTAINDTLKLSSGSVSSYYFSGDDAIFKVGSGSVKILYGKTKAITVTDSKNKSATYQNGLIYNNANVSKANAFTVSSVYAENILEAEDYGAAVVSIDASGKSSAMEIYGNAKNNFLTGTGKNDTLNGGKGNDTLTGGNGNDIFVYNDGSGADVIADFTAGQDSIKIASGTISDYVASGKDLTLKVGKGNIKVKGGKSTAITIVDSVNNVSIYQDGLIYSGNSKAMTVTGSYGNKLTSYNANVETIDASARTKAVDITGNAKANFIIGTKVKDTVNGGAGADTLTGGKGDDILTGGAGNDVFIYSSGDGKDTITDFGAGDIISLTTAEEIIYTYSTLKGGKANSIFKIGKGSITVKDSKDTAVTIFGADGSASIANNKSFFAVNDIPDVSQGITVTVTVPGDAETVTVYDTITVGGGTETVYDTVTVPGAAETVTVYDTITVGGGTETVYDTITVTIETAANDIPHDAFEYNGHSYYIYSGVAENWDDAKYYAEELGGYLAIINDTAENTAVYDYMRSRGYSSAYFGYTDSDVEANWKWAKGDTLSSALSSYSNWAPGEPSNGVNNNAGRENYGMFYWWYRYTWNDGDFAYIDYDNGSQAFIVEWDGLRKNTAIKGLKFNSGNTAVTINSTYNQSNFSAASYSDLVSITSAGKKNLNIIGNSNANYIKGGKGSDTLTGGEGADVFIYGGDNDFDVITDYYEDEDKISIGANAVSGGMVVGSDVILAVGNGGLRLIGAKDKKVTIVGGGTETEYVNGIIPGSGGGTVPVETIPADETLDVDYNGVTVTLEADRNTNFTLSSYNSTASIAAVNIDGSQVRNNIWIYGDDEANIIYGANKSNSTIRAGYGDDVIYCGRGNDFIYYRSDEGNETIYNYKTGDRIIQQQTDSYDETTFKNISLSGNDVIINFTNGSKMTLKDAKEQQISIGGYTYNRDPYYSANLYDYYNTFGNITISGGSATLDTKYKGNFNIAHYAANIANVDASSVKNATVNVYGSDSANVIHAAQDGGWIYAYSGNDTIYGSDNGNATIRAGYGDDVIYCGRGNDFIYYRSDEGNETIYNYKTGDRIIQQQTDSYDETTFKNISLSGNDVIINFTNGNKITLKDAKEQQIIIDDPDSYYNSTFGNITISSGSATLDTKYKGNFNIAHYAANIVNVDASSVKNATVNVYGSDSANVIHAAQDGGWIYAYSGNDTIYGSDNGNATIRAGYGDDVIYCGRGNDFIYYYSDDGNETVYNFKTGDRIIQRRVDSYDDTTFKNISLSGNDVIINFTNGNKITLKDAKEQQIIIDDPDSYYNSTFGNITISSGSATLDTKYKGNFNIAHYAANIANVDASSVKNATVNVYGSDSANVIHAAQDGGWIYAYGGSDTIYGSDNGNATIRAGYGDDVIYCGRGNDFIYYYSDDGNETVYNFKTGDRIIQRRVDSYDDTTFKNISLSGNDVIINFTNGNKITLKDAKEQQIYIDDPVTSYTITKDNIADYTGGTSANVAEEKIWFLEDDNNFVTSDIDSITQENNSLTNLNLNPVETENIFAQDNLISYNYADNK